MATPEEIRARCNIYGMLLVPGALALALILLAPLYIPALSGLRTVMFYGIVLALCLGIIVAVQLWRAGPGKMSRPLLILGFVNLFGGAAFDMAATAINDPFLDRELNPIVRAMQSAGFSHDGIYIYALVAQVCMQTLFFVVWAAFLRHKDTLLALAWSTNPVRRREFLRAAYTRDRLTWWSLLTNTNVPPGYHRRAYYHQVWFAAILIQFVGIYRWYLGLLAFGLVPFSIAPFVAVAVFLGGIGAYSGWLSYEFVKGKPVNVEP